MLKIQCALKVLAKNSTVYTKDGAQIPAYSVATINEGVAENVNVNIDVFNKVEEGHTYILGGTIGSTKYGKFWHLSEVVKDVTDEKEKK